MGCPNSNINYPTWEQAEDAIIRAKKVHPERDLTKRAYYCHSCKGYHVVDNVNKTEAT